MRKGDINNSESEDICFLEELLPILDFEQAIQTMQDVVKVNFKLQHPKECCKSNETLYAQDRNK